MKRFIKSMVVASAAVLDGAQATIPLFKNRGENLRRKRVVASSVIPARHINEDEFVLKDQNQLEDFWTQAVLFGEEERMVHSRTLQSLSMTARPTTPSPTGPPSPRPTIPATPSPTDTCLTGTTRAAFIQQQITSQGISTAAQLQNTNTPQGRAFNWLVNTDPLNIDPCTFGTTVQRYGLATFFYSTNGELWRNNTNWLGNTNECQWFGITCESNQNSTVTRVTLSQNQASGSIPSEISALTGALRIDLYSNSIQGSIPSSIGSLSLLELLDVEENDLSGPIFTTTGVLRLTNLVALRGSFNDFTGTIPTEIGNLNNLEQLWFADNGRISGSIPSQIGALTSLESIFAYANALNGTIPTQFAGTNQANLTQIRLYNNALIGSIPSQLVGPLGLETLRLDNNQLTGSIPTQIGQLAFLQDFRINENNIFGRIPSEIGNLLALQNLILNNNFFSGDIPEQAFTTLSSDLRFVDISNNRFLRGSIPSTLFVLPSVRNIYLSNCSLTGTMPSNYGTASNLRDLFVDGNNLNGTVPEIQTGQLPQLNEFLLHRNTFTGSVPASVCQLRNTQGGTLEDLWSDCQGNPPEILCDFPVCCNRCF